MDCTMPTLSPFLAWVSCQGSTPTIDDENDDNSEAATTATERRAAYLRRDSSWSVDVLEIDPSSYATRLPAATPAAMKNYEEKVGELQRFYYKRRTVSQQQQLQQLQQVQQQQQQKR